MQGYQGLTPESIISITEPVLSMLMHASWVANKRHDIKRKFEATCVGCGDDRVVDDLCSSCGLYQPNRKFNTDSYTLYDEIEFPPNSGKIWKGDDEMGALERMQKEDPALFVRYNQWVLANGINQSANEIAKRKGLFK